jgi:hypothetical protein
MRQYGTFEAYFTMVIFVMSLEVFVVTLDIVVFELFALYAITLGVVIFGSVANFL